MNLNDLMAMGAITPRTVFKRDIKVKFRPLKPENEWAEKGNPEHEDNEVEKTITVFIRKANSADLLEITNANDRQRPFVAIYRCICNEDGSEVFPDLETTTTIAPWLLIPLFNVIQTVNPDSKKKSLRKMNSGVKSLSV